MFWIHGATLAVKDLEVKRILELKSAILAQKPNLQTVERAQQSAAIPSLQAILWFLPSSLC